MQKIVWPLITISVILLLTLSLGGCLKITVPQNTSQTQPAQVLPSSLPASGTASAKPEVVSFVASPADIGARGASTLTWNVKGANKTMIDQGIGNVAPSGSAMVTPGQTTLYTLTAMNDAGGTVATVVVTVAASLVPLTTVAPAPAGMPVIQFFTANPAAINAGETAILNWIVSNASLVTVGVPGTRQMSEVLLSGSGPVSPAATTVYVLAATNSAGTTEKSLTVIVNAQQTVPATTQYNSWAGTWDTNWGNMQLTQSTGKVTGTYTHDSGKIIGYISKNLTGDMLTGTWSETPSYAPPHDAGDIEWTMAPDFMSFTGKWRYGSSGDWIGGWKGTRITP